MIPSFYLFSSRGEGPANCPGATWGAGFVLSSVSISVDLLALPCPSFVIHLDFSAIPCSLLLWPLAWHSAASAIFFWTWPPALWLGSARIPLATADSPGTYGRAVVRSYGRASLVSGPWSLVLGPWSLVPGLWSLVSSHWSLVLGPCPLVGSDRVGSDRLGSDRILLGRLLRRPIRLFLPWLGA